MTLLMFKEDSTMKCNQITALFVKSMFSGILFLLNIYCWSNFLSTGQTLRVPLLTSTVMQTHANRGSDSKSASVYRSCRSKLLFCTCVNAGKETTFTIASSKGVVQTVTQNKNWSSFPLFFLKILLNFLTLC